jgi:23S rRNA G2445 N2-methylase RlmL
MSGKRKKDKIVEKEKRPILITCSKGAVPFLAAEVASLRYRVLSAGTSGLTTEGTMEDTMMLNLFVRTGQRVLFLLAEFAARDPEELYRAIHAMAWERHIDDHGYVCVTSVADHPAVLDSRYVNLKVKDAIVDRIREKCGRRPDSGPDRSRSVVSVYWRDGRCLVYLDTSGEPLSKRGYRKIPLRAPMQETLAATVVAATGWKGQSNFVNPMCGSGTIAIEAALAGLDRAPGLTRTNFGFMHLKGFDRRLWETVRSGAEERVKRGINGRIIATDRNPEAVAASRKNAEAAGVAAFIKFHVCDFAETEIPEGGGAVVLNPEYGERMGNAAELGETYGRIGDFFKKRCSGYRGYIFTGNPGLGRKVGLRTRRRLAFFSGGIECRLLEYELYEGSRKNERQED